MRVALHCIGLMGGSWCGKCVQRRRQRHQTSRNAISHLWWRRTRVITHSLDARNVDDASGAHSKK